MKRRCLRFFYPLFCLLLLLPWALAQSDAPQSDHPNQPTSGSLGAPAPWEQIPVPPLPAFHPAVPARIVLPNGMVIFLEEDHELPLITATALIRGGSRLEPASKVGLVDIYGEVWRTGGTQTRTGDQLDDFLEARAAKIETDGDVDSTVISLDCLKADFDDVFKLFLEVLQQPAFRSDKLELAKQQVNTTISRRNDDIGHVANREAAMLAYGKDNPYARVPEYATVAAVTRQDLVNWHQNYVHPNNILLGMVGDFDSKSMEAKLRQAFASWPRGPDAPPFVFTANPAKPALYLVEKSDVNQSAIRMVGPGIERRNPDYFAVQVMNEIFGGGFSSRLFSNIRSKKGLAYNVGGGVGSAYDHPGTFRLVMGTKSATTAESINALYDELLDLVKNPATETELKRAKDSILNSFIFRLDTPEKVLRERMAYEFYGYPQDFLERYRAGVEKVSAADVARVARKYVPKKEQLAVLVVGNPSELGSQLASLGPVQKLDISIPPPAGLARRATAKPGN